MAQSIRDFFHLYENVKTSQNNMKYYSIITQKTHIVKYLQKNKKMILDNINFAFFESDEPYILSVFKSKKGNYIHINSKLTQKVPRSIIDFVSGFERQDLIRELEIHEYENWLAIFGTFSILLDNQSLRIRKDFNDDKPYTVQDLLRDSRNQSFLNDKLCELTEAIYYDETFRINLENFIQNQEDKVLKYVYRYGYDFLLNCFKSYNKNELLIDNIKDYLKISNDEFKELYELFKNKILLEN